MSRKCSIINCKSFDGECAFFGVPKASVDTWTKIVSTINGHDTKIKFVCEKHFLPKDIIKNYAAKVKDINFPNRARFSLVKGAIPQLLQQNVEKHNECDVFVIEGTAKRTNEGITHIQKTFKCRKQFIWSPEKESSFMQISTSYQDTEASPINLNSYQQNLSANLKNIQDNIILPKGWYIHDDEVVLTYFKVKYERTEESVKVIIEKQIVITEDQKIMYFVKDNTITEQCLGIKIVTNSINEKIQCSIDLFDSKSLCSGGPSIIDYPGITAKHAIKDKNNIWRHKKCSHILHQSNKKRCIWCERLCSIHRVFVYRQKQRLRTNLKKQIGPTLTPIRAKIFYNLNRAKYLTRKSNLRYKKKIEQFNNKLKNIQNKKKKSSENSINEVLTNSTIGESQQILIREILSTSKYMPKNKRYSENWMLLCILLHIRSSSTYNFLREQEILPLPCSRTIRKYLTMVKCNCGFDEHFFKLFKKKIGLLKDNEKHGVILFDEIFLRESINVDTRNLTYSGLENFGKDESSLNSGQKADHGLVLMFQSLGSNITQPIGVFASKGSVKGVVLTQLIIKAISLLEMVGVKVDGIVSDAGSTNRKLWRELGICGKFDNLKNYIIHPMNEKRRIYFFTDAPHEISFII